MATNNDPVSTTDHEHIANAVKAAITAANSSYRKVCAGTGIAFVTLNRRLNGQRTFTVEELIAIADFLNCRVSSFLPKRHALV